MGGGVGCSFLERGGVLSIVRSLCFPPLSLYCAYSFLSHCSLLPLCPPSFSLSLSLSLLSLSSLFPLSLFPFSFSISSLSSLLSTEPRAGLPERELQQYDRRMHPIGSYEFSQPDLARYRATPHTFPCVWVSSESK